MEREEEKGIGGGGKKGEVYEGRAKGREIETEKVIRTETEYKGDSDKKKKGIKGQRVLLNVITMAVSGWKEG